MTITSYPFENQDTTESQYSRLFRELQDSGVAGTLGGTGFAVSANASGMQVTVQAGFAILRGHAVSSTATETVPIAAATSAVRIDRVVLRLDAALDAIVLAVVQGVAGGGMPSLTRSDTGIFEVSLAQVAVSPGVASIAADKVVDDRQYIGSRVGIWTTPTRPTGQREGKLGLNATTDRWEFWNGVDWSDLAPDVAWSAIAGKPVAFSPSAHGHGWNELTGVPSSFTPAAHSHAWNGITDKPGSFPPAEHDHAGADITTGTVPIARLPTGTSASTVAVGSHTHAYAAASHGHANPAYATRSDGSDRVHGNTPAGSGWYSVWVDGNHNFCHNTSSIRYKTNVRDHDIHPADVLALRPVLFDRKDTVEDGVTTPGRVDEYGLIAEEVDEHVPELTIRDEDGQIEALRYDLLPVALLSVVRDQQARIEKLENQIAGLQTAVKLLAGEGTAGGE